MLAGFREAQKRQDKVYQVITWFETDPSQQGHRDKTMTQWLFFLLLLLLLFFYYLFKNVSEKQTAFTPRLPRQRLCWRRLKKEKKEEKREEM